MKTYKIERNQITNWVTFKKQIDKSNDRFVNGIEANNVLIGENEWLVQNSYVHNGGVVHYPYLFTTSEKPSKKLAKFFLNEF